MNVTSVMQKIICWYYGKEYRQFSQSLADLETVQKKQLKLLLEYLKPYNQKIKTIQDYETFRNQVPITHYSDWKNEIDEIRNQDSHPFHQICSRFEPTSGSTNAMKWIPYTQGFLSEINKAAATWLYDTFQQYPAVLKGKHYWSLSWVPPEMRSTHNSNDVDLFPVWQRGFLSKIMAVPEQIKKAKTQEACWFATLVYLVACEDLSLISIWSPTFLLQLVKDLYQFQDLISQSLNQGSWDPLYAHELMDVPCPQQKKQAVILQSFQDEIKSQDLTRLWPKLALISSWDSSTAAAWIPEVKKIFPQVPLQGKGLWATEGVVSIPFRGKKILSLNSHFYEFRCLETNKIYPSWNLKKDMLVQPIISSKNSLLRYELPDKMIVTGFFESVPCFEFISRINSIDLVGEKFDFDFAQDLIQQINIKFGVRALCFIAEKKAHPKPKYKLLIEGDSHSQSESRMDMESYLEGKLCSHYHYQLSRSLGQLAPAEVLFISDTLPFLKRFQRSAIGGNNKIEPIFVSELEAVP